MVVRMVPCEIAAAEGARVIHVPVRGYGAALIAGSTARAGTYVLMADADDSYEFGHLPRFLKALDSGSDLVMAIAFAVKSSPEPCHPCTATSAIRS